MLKSLRWRFSRNALVLQRRCWFRIAGQNAHNRLFAKMWDTTEFGHIFLFEAHHQLKKLNAPTLQMDVIQVYGAACNAHIISDSFFSKILVYVDK